MSHIPYLLSSMLVWLCRSPYSRGFGVQSPWAYSFIRYVINEHYPYYAYERLEKTFLGISKNMLKLCQLYFRIANYCQPDLIVHYGSCTECDEILTYFKAGCNKTEVMHYDKEDAIEEIGTALALCKPLGLVCISLEDDYCRFFDVAIENTDSKSVFILQGIHNNKDTKKFWDAVVADDRTGVTFDLYYCGIVFFDKDMYKRNYIINF